MTRAMTVAALLLPLGACGTSSAPPAAGKPAPVGPPPPSLPDEPIVCVADVKRCPDGSYVTRNPDNTCAFNPCPGEGNNSLHFRIF